MAVDAVTAEVAGAFEAAGVDCVLLKGPTVAGWLYDDAADRPYVDTDLLVDPDGLGAAHAALEAAGFRKEFGPLPHVAMERPPSYAWRRGAFTVDLHLTLPGAIADPHDVWAVLRAGCAEQEVSGRSTRVLGREALLAVLALHSAHHGPDAEGPLRDLNRALERVADEDWAAAAEVADRIGAGTAFANGLGLTSRGRGVLARLGRQPVYSTEWLLEIEGVPLAAGIERLALARGVRAKGAILRDELFPSREFMRWWTPMARGSWPGLVRAYLWRWLHLVRSAPAALRAWRRARAQV